MLRERNSNVCRQEYPILASQSITRNSNGEREGFLLAQSLLKNKLTCNTYTIEISKIAAKKFRTLYFVLQNQVATLLQVKSCHADASQIQRLTQALVQKEGEVKMLNTKISTLEKQKVTCKYY